MKQLVFPILDFIFDHMVQLTEVILAEPDVFFYVLASSFLIQADANIKNISLGTIRVATLARH